MRQQYSNTFINFFLSILVGQENNLTLSYRQESGMCLKDGRLGYVLWDNMDLLT